MVIQKISQIKCHKQPFCFLLYFYSKNYNSTIIRFRNIEKSQVSEYIITNLFFLTLFNFIFKACGYLLVLGFRKMYLMQGRIQDFKLGGGGAYLKKLCRGTKMFGVFRVKNQDFTPKKSYLFQF